MWKEGQPTRRQVVQIVATGTAVALAGCASSSGESDDDGEDDDTESGSGDSSTEGDGAVESVSVDGSELVIELDPDVSVRDIQIYGPGNDVWSDEPLRGSTIHNVELIGDTGYEPGTHTIEARNSDSEVVGSSLIELEPDLQLVAFGLGREYEEEIEFQDEEIIENWRKRPVVEVENQGSGPDTITKIGFDDVSDQYDPDDVKGDLVVSPGQTSSVWSGRKIFWGSGFGGPNYACGELVTLDLTVETVVSENLESSVEFTSEVDESEVSDIRDPDEARLADNACYAEGEMT